MAKITVQFEYVLSSYADFTLDVEDMKPETIRAAMEAAMEDIDFGDFQDDAESSSDVYVAQLVEGDGEVYDRDAKHLPIPPDLGAKAAICRWQGWPITTTEEA